MINASAKKILSFYATQLRDGRITQDTYNYQVAELKRTISLTEQTLDQQFKHDSRRAEFEKQRQEYWVSC